MSNRNNRSTQQVGAGSMRGLESGIGSTLELSGLTMSKRLVPFCAAVLLLSHAAAGALLYTTLIDPDSVGLTTGSDSKIYAFCF